MFEFIGRLFDSDFMPHIACMRKDPATVYLHLISDALIALAYYSIPIWLVYFVRKRRDVAFDYVLLWFGAFIFACGTTHLMSIWTLWDPIYRFEGVIKLTTAVVSIYTAFLLWRLTPVALAVPSPQQLAAANTELQTQVRERLEAEAAVLRINAELEQRVQERTTELTRANEELRHRNAEMEQFTYTVSHDLKSPLVTVQGYAGLIEHESQRGSADRLVEYAREIKAAGQHMSTLIGDLLELSRIGRVVGEPRQVDIAEIARHVGRTHVAQLESRGIRYVVRDDIPPVVADAHRIGQVIDNLVVNAIKYGVRDTGTIIEVGGEASSGEVRIYVRDNGPGIPTEYQGRIFDLFQRLHAEPDGTGVGLAIVKRIMEVHNGRVWVESRPDEGATFWIALPIGPADSTA